LNLEYSGELYSEEHKWKFMTKEIRAKVITDKGRFALTMNLQPIRKWLKEQLEKLRQDFIVQQLPKQNHFKLYHNKIRNISILRKIYHGFFVLL